MAWRPGAQPAPGELRQLHGEQPARGLLEDGELAVLDDAACPHRVDARAVPREGVAQFGPGTPVPVPAHGGRLVDQPVSACEQAREHLVIAAGPGRRAGVEALVERAHQLQHVATHRHVRAGTDLSGRLRAAVQRVELVAEVAAAERAAALEPLLGRRLELQRQRQTGGGGHQRMVERPAERIQPAVFRCCIIVRKRDDLGGGLAEGAVARGIQSRRVFPDVGDVRMSAYRSALLHR